MVTVRLPPMPSVSDITRIYKLSARKKLGQNFIFDLAMARKIVRSAGNLKGSHVCEVGPGPGPLTRCILEAEVESLSVVEKDRRFLPSLQVLADAVDPRMRIFHGDVLHFDSSLAFPEHASCDWFDAAPSCHLIGNLPFNVSLPLTLMWMREISTRTQAWSRGRVPMTLTYQRRRLALGVKDWKWESVRDGSGSWFGPTAEAFVPAPAVRAAVLQLLPRRRPLIDAPFRLLYRVLEVMMHYPNKRIYRAVRDFFPKEAHHLRERFFIMVSDIHCVKPDMLPRSLSLTQWRAVCDVYQKLCDEYPSLARYHHRSHPNALLRQTEDVVQELKEAELAEHLSQQRHHLAPTTAASLPFGSQPDDVEE